MVQPIPYNNFTKGETSVATLSNTPKGYSSKLQNCHVSPRGGVLSIPGYLRVNAAAVPVTLTTGIEFTKTDGTVITLCAGGGIVYKVGATGALTAIYTFLSTTAEVCFEGAGNKIYFANGDELQKAHSYDGANVVDITNFPVNVKPFKPCLHRGRMWWTDSANSLSPVHSALNNFTDYTTANDAGYLDFQFNIAHGDVLVRMRSYADLHVFYFTNTIMIYSGTIPSGDQSNYSVVQQINGTGILGDTTVDLGSDQAFLHGTGVKSLKQVVTTGNLSLGDLSDAIDPTLKKEIALNANGIYGSAHYFKKSATGDNQTDKDHGWYMCLINDKVWLYSYRWKAWARMAGADVHGMFGSIDGKVYLCGKGYLYEYGQGWTFDGNNPAFVWETAWMPLSKDGRPAYPSEVQIYNFPLAYAKGVTMQVLYDYNVCPTDTDVQFDIEPLAGLMDTEVLDVWEDGFLLDNPYHDHVRLPLSGSGRAIKFIFTYTGNVPMEFSELVIEVS